MACVAVAVAVAGCGSSGKSKGAAPQTSASAGGQVPTQDAAAKAAARNLVTAVETCYVDSQTYSSCTGKQLSAAGLASGITIGSQPGQVDVAVTDQGYTVTSHSKSGDTFVAKRQAQGPLTRSCTATAAGGGCQNGIW